MRPPRSRETVSKAIDLEDDDDSTEAITVNFIDGGELADAIHTMLRAALVGNPRMQIAILLDVVTKLIDQSELSGAPLDPPDLLARKFGRELNSRIRGHMNDRLHDLENGHGN